MYEYICDNCGNEFEAYQTFDSKPFLRCRDCKLETLRRVYKPVGIVFKGSGFYTNDNRRVNLTDAEKLGWKRPLQNGENDLL